MHLAYRNRCWTGLCLALGTALLSLSLPDRAQAEYRIVPLTPGGGYRANFGRDHYGFLLRGTLGLGYMQARTSDVAGSLRLYGAAPQYSLSVGGMIARNFAITGTFFGASLIGTQQDGDVRANNADRGKSLHTAAVGLGISYYFMPVNVYIAVAIGPAYARIESTAYNVDEHEVGFGSEWSVAKEWWVAPHLGLGLGGRLHVLQIPGSNDASYSVFSAGIFSSLSFN